MIEFSHYLIAQKQPPVYQPLRNLTALQEANYRHITQLIYGLDFENNDHYTVYTNAPDTKQKPPANNTKSPTAQEPHTKWHTTIFSKTIGPYTQDIYLYQNLVQKDWLEYPKMHLRIYHDAKLCDVQSYNDKQAHFLVYTGTDGRYHKYEKEMINRFLNVWLQQCLQYRDHISAQKIT